MSRPLVLVGETRSRHTVARLRDLGWGRMWIESRPSPYAGEPWGLDNGAFGCWRRGLAFDGDRYLRRVERAWSVGVPYLAVAPDIVAGGLASLAFSLDWLPRLPAEWPWYVAVQDDLTQQDVAPEAARFAGVFLGGTTTYKRSAAVWCAFAHDRGMRFHYARAGTLDKLAHAAQIGADSLDSSFPLWTRARFETFARFWRQDPRLRLPLAAEERYGSGRVGGGAS